ncbi:MAG: 16S rRNA (cytidine(1402)-2'-O)-methyltransferase [Andreesenia angusta]|nr:16S rRNA (cytidine(1402)-2'-O)-methyltransferase [Andreesenia angusta]
MNEIGRLYICPTPIGNLEDITIRTLNTLKEVDLIIAEDTRHSLKLLNHFGIKKPLSSYHEHNKFSKEGYIIDRLMRGENIALVSDAGMPGISDPGEEIIKTCIENGIEVIGLPGPTASILALVISGLCTKKFVFEGFLPSKKSERIKHLEEIKYEGRTLIFYESPHRLLKTLKDILNTFGDRNISLARELTKKFEEINRGRITEIIEIYSNRDIKGEIVIVIEGSSEKENNEEISVEDELKKLLSEGFSKKDAVKKLSKEKNLPRNEVYKYSVNLE